MNQLAFDLQPPLARRSDPITSHQAAAKAREFQPSHADRILAALRKLGPSTAHEIERETGLSVVQCDRRVSELRRAGLVAIATDAGGTPLTRTNAQGRAATVWEAV